MNKPRPYEATPEAIAWFAALVREARAFTMQTRAAVELNQLLDRDLPHPSGAYLLLCRAINAYDLKKQHTMPTMHELVSRSLCDACLLRSLERTEHRYVAHVLATGTLLEIHAVRQELFDTNSVVLPVGFREEDFEDEPEHVEPLPAPVLEGATPLMPVIRRRRTAQGFYLAKHD